MDHVEAEPWQRVNQFIMTGLRMAPLLMLQHIGELHFRSLEYGVKNQGWICRVAPGSSALNALGYFGRVTDLQSEVSE